MDTKKDETLSVDTETGEILYPSQYNAETGEYEGFLSLPPRTTFRIPPEQKPDKEPHKESRTNCQVLELITAALFLLPTAILSYPIVSILIVLLEMIIHNWVHKKNKTLQSDTFYYKSPLHGIVKEFCGRCKDLNTKEKISKLQDMRNEKMKKYGLESIRRVVT